MTGKGPLEPQRTIRIYILLAIFGIAMGLLEAIVVVYLRQIYYPRGFEFPLKSFSLQLISVEWLREVATIVMLVCLSLIAGRGFLQQFSCFLFSFAVWDIFYYTGLKLLLDWPPSLLTWDVLFLIPITWLGPVLAPLICSLTMILTAGCITFLQARGCRVRMGLPEWALLAAGGLIIFAAFIWEYARILIEQGFISDFFRLGNSERFLSAIAEHRPAVFQWRLFVLGELLALGAPVLLLIKTLQNRSR